MQREPETNPKRSFTRGLTATIAAAAVLIPAGGSIAAAAERAGDETDDRAGSVELIDSRGTTIGRALDAAELRVDYTDELERAKKLDAEPANPADPDELVPARLSDELETLRERVRKAERVAKAEAAEPKVGTPESVGVSTATLESIAACESGGDPTAVSSTGDYRGKYQFDYGTWASVGGAGDPAAAPEAEQDYRAALLYSQSGSTPWPVCG